MAESVNVKRTNVEREFDHLSNNLERGRLSETQAIVAALKLVALELENVSDQLSCLEELPSTMECLTNDMEKLVNAGKRITNCTDKELMSP